MQVEVYIATTHGLINIQSITALPDVDISSVVTINHTSQLAGMSQDYADFIHPTSGVIAKDFGHSSFRLNVSGNIEQGFSWHLGVYIAHYLHCHSQLFCAKPTHIISHEKGRDDDTQSDAIIIATGCINTVNRTVTRVGDLPKKCLMANPMIQNWLLQNKRVYFLAPVENLKEPIPDTSIQLTPIYNLDEMKRLLSVIGISHITDNHSDELNRDIESGLVISDTINAKRDERDEQAVIYSIHSEKTKQSTSGPEHVVDLPNKFYVFKMLSSLLNFKLSLIAITLTVVGVVTWAFINQPKTEELAASLLVASGQGTCSDVSLNLYAEWYWQKSMKVYGTSNLKTTQLKNLCDLFFITTKDIPAVWMITDSKGVFDLSQQTLNNHLMAQLIRKYKDKQASEKNERYIHPSQNSIWHIPIPSNQLLNRRYFLLVFSSPPDLADSASFQAQLLNYYQNGVIITEQDIIELSEKLNMSTPIMVFSHVLKK